VTTPGFQSWLWGLKHYQSITKISLGFKNLKGCLSQDFRKTCHNIDHSVDEYCKAGGQRREISRVRARIAYHLSREMGISMAEIARNIDVGTSAVAMAIKKEESSNNN
jgi:DNA-binding MarR family transcriptional regulator